MYPGCSASLRIAPHRLPDRAHGTGREVVGSLRRHFSQGKQTNKQKDIWDCRRGVNDGGSWSAIGNVCGPVGKQKGFWRRLILRQPPPVCFHLMGFEIPLEIRNYFLIN